MDIDWLGEYIPDFKFHLYTIKDLVENLERVTRPELELYLKTLRIHLAETQEEADALYHECLDVLKGQNWESEWRLKVAIVLTILYLQLWLSFCRGRMLLM